jgi:diguanylate cyclase (GGDEF)-like protein
MADHLRVENHVLADMAGLAASDAEYPEVVQAMLDLIEEVVSCPLLTLSVREDEIRHYHRVAPDTDPAWSGEAALFTADAARHDLSHTRPAEARREHHLAVPPAWVTIFTACTRSGRACAISLAAAEPPRISPAEEHMMLRLARQVALVLDHAILCKQEEDLATVDPLTGVVSHRHLMEILEYEMQRHRHTGRWLALMMIDVEGLDGINRSYGRQYGNHILRRLAAMLSESVRPIDIVARCGLDEFAVVLPETETEDAERLADRVHELIGGVEFAGGAIGLSTAVAHVRPDEVVGADSLLRRAETALQESKRHERSWSALTTPRPVRRTM